MHFVSVSQGLCDLGAAYMHNCCSKVQSQQSLPYAVLVGMVLMLIVTLKIDSMCKSLCM